MQVRASVAMAVYNGEKYLRQQIDSIIPMLSNDDELVISYDNSKDSTLTIINDYAIKYPNVHIYNNVFKKGVSGNFTNAAVHCRGKYILFSDQDDIWLDDKINKMVKAIEETNADLVIHDGFITNADLVCYQKTLHQLNSASASPFKNFIKGRFLGCCMCFRKETMKYVLPFPDITSNFPHDIFATIMVGLRGKIIILSDILIKHRLHEGNETPKKRYPIFIIIYNRIILLFEIIKRLLRKKDFDI